MKLSREERRQYREIMQPVIWRLRWVNLPLFALAGMFAGGVFGSMVSIPATPFIEGYVAQPVALAIVKVLAITAVFMLGMWTLAEVEAGMRRDWLFRKLKEAQAR